VRAKLIVSLVLLTTVSCAHEPANRPSVGWSTTGRLSGPDAGGFMRYIISGSAEAVAEFTSDATKNGWMVEARAESSSNLVFVQFRAPIVVGQLEYFTDKYFMQRPRRINVAPVVAKVDPE